MSEGMPESVRQEFNRVYDRLGEERENRHTLEKAVLQMTSSVNTLAKTVGTHIDDHDGKRRDWKGLWIAIASTAVGGVLGALILYKMGVHP